ncbi:MAG: thioesterase superfamily [Sphingomonas bacterium]|uniref:acyl-CoA thioesterase n=1 Tax=Sphingomonas bacterium TaxID=1895847 RepID=UPI0026380BD8|nr:acyl-CoA thioesterase [Sphingomonas bacterium]MDB5710313.1 thioesterase superfamily [Sphingomonas bacterium]
MTRPAPWRLDPSAYPVGDEFGTRYQDLDPNGHLNNVAFAALFENARVRINRATRPRPANERMMVASVTIAYLREGSFPEPVTICSGIGRIGSSSWTIEQAMFQADQCIATCDTVVVCRTDDAAKPLRAEVRAELGSRMTRGG